MSENDKIPSRLSQKESFIGEQNPDKEDLKDDKGTPYPNQEKTEGADNEQFIINNSNGNGINPNSTESGNKPEWVDGRKQADDHIEDAPD